MAAILNFRIFRKIAKHKNAYISKTVPDRAISTAMPILKKKNLSRQKWRPF